MNKESFLKELQSGLAVLAESEQQDILAEYAQHIDMRMASGLTEEEAIRDFGDIRQLTAVSVMELLMGAVSGIAALHLKPLLITEVLDHIVAQKLRRLLDLSPALALGAGIHQAVDSRKELAVLGINQRISSHQVLCQFIFHLSSCSFLTPTAPPQGQPFYTYIGCRTEKITFRQEAFDKMADFLPQTLMFSGDLDDIVSKGPGNPSRYAPEHTNTFHHTWEGMQWSIRSVPAGRTPSPQHCTAKKANRSLCGLPDSITIRCSFPPT